MIGAPLFVGTALTLAATAGVLLASSAPAPAQQPPLDATHVYLRDCATCHGAEGRGTNRGPTLIGVGEASADYELTTGRMPLGEPTEPVRRHEPAYPPAMIAALVAHVAGFGGGGPDIPRVDAAGADISLGGELFRQQCAGCHSWSGTGGALLYREAPTLQPSTPTQVAEAVRIGPGTMPAFGPAAIDETQLDALVAYVKKLQHPADRGGASLWHLGPLVEGGVAIIVGLGASLLVIRWIGERE